MSRLEELIHELCPHGVKKSTLREHVFISDGYPFSSKDYTTSGGLPLVRIGDIFDGRVYKSGVYIFGEKDTDNKGYLITGGEILVGMSGSTGKTGFNYSLTAYVNQRIAIIKAKGETLNNRYLRHLLVNSQFEKYCNDLGTGPQKNISKNQILKFEIPVPPLPVQQEIVRILDTFTNLQEELKAELEDRKKQFHYYMEALLKGSATKYTSINQICRKVSSGGTPNSKNLEYYRGNIPWLRTQEVIYEDIYDTEIKITEKAYNESSAHWIPENSVIVAMYGASAARVAVNKIPLTTNQACCNLEVDSAKANYRYVYYWLSLEYENLKSLAEGAQANLNAQKIKDYPIPSLPLDKQNEIVQKLDAFSDLSTSTNFGLPAEIETRRKQYEYYRNKLLTFKEKA